MAAERDGSVEVAQEASMSVLGVGERSEGRAMSMATLVLAEETYLHAALRALREELAARMPARRERLREKAAQRVEEWLEWVELLEEADLANHQRAAREPEWDFAAADAENERQCRAALALGREWLAVCDDLAAGGAPVANRDALERGLRDLQETLDWSDDYAATPAYGAIAREAASDYGSGKLQEGGWEP